MAKRVMGRVTRRGSPKRRLKKGKHVGEAPYQHDLDTEPPHYTNATLHEGGGHQFSRSRRGKKKPGRTRRVL